MAKEYIASGHDDYGNFRIYIKDTCSKCGQLKVTMKYTQPVKLLILPDYVKEANGLIYKNAPLGITCGCYAKFQRQVVHITEGRKRR